MPQPPLDLTPHFPYLTPLTKTRTLAGVRPFRRGGIRLQLQTLAQKTLIHNYGHGGAGISLAPATALQSASLARQVLTRGDEVAVLGCGVVGLMSALECAQGGLRVVVYSERIPQQGEKGVEVMCTSEVAPGYWLPYHYEFTDQAEHDRRSEVSYRRYGEMVARVGSVRKVQVFEDMDIEEIRKKAPAFIADTAEQVVIKIGSRSFPVIRFQTFQIHLQHFLQQIIVMCRQKGVKFEQKSFANTDDVLGLKQSCIINCLGLGSKKVFNDSNMYGVKGHLLQFQNSTKIRGIFGFKHQGQPVKLYCFDDKILLGLTKQEVEHTRINTQLVQQLQNRAYEFYSSLQLATPRPKL